MDIKTIILIISACVMILFWLFKKWASKKIAHYLDDVLKNNLTNFISSINSENQALFKDERKELREATEDRIKLIDEYRKQIDNIIDKTQKEINSANVSSKNLTSALKSQIETTQKLDETTKKLNATLSNNQHRGEFGQKIAEDLLKIAGFIIGYHYLLQETQECGRPDITLLFPDKTKLNIDVKFPLRHLLKFRETEDAKTQASYKGEFEKTLKKQQTEVKKYISPKDNTLDFVILLIPNELVFSYVFEKFPNIWEEANNNKIIMCGPISFIAILRMVIQAHDNFRYQKNLESIVQHVRLFEQELNNSYESLSDLGEKIDAVLNQYNEVKGKRQNELMKMLNKIKTTEIQSTTPELNINE